MKKNVVGRYLGYSNFLLILLILGVGHHRVLAADKLMGVYAAQSLSSSMPWIAQEAGIFRRYNLDFQLIFIASGQPVIAALLGGDAEVSVGGGVAMIRAFVQGGTDLVVIGGIKNVLTHSILAGPKIKRLEDLKGKKSGSAGSAAMATILLSRPSGVSAWTLIGIPPSSKLAGTSRHFLRWLAAPSRPPQ